MDQIPLRPFLDLLTQGVVAPRAAARRVIDARPGPGERLALVGLAAALQGMMWGAIGLISPGFVSAAFTGGLGFGGQAALAALMFLNYAITATGAFHIGRRLGGRGSPADVATAVGWHAVLTAALTPLQAMAVAGGSPLFVLFYAGLNLWLLSACVAEAHGFASTGRVMGATSAIFLGAGLFLSLLIAAIAAP
jgi:hypothetical protein